MEGTGHRIGKLLGQLSLAFPSRKLTPDQGAFYVLHLADLPPEALEEAVHGLIRAGGDFFPSISAIRAAAAEEALALPAPAEALQQVYERIVWARGGRADQGETAVHPLVKQALEQVGGWYTFRSGAEASIVRGQFLRIYGELRTAALRDVQVGPPALTPAPERKELSA